MKNAKSLFEDTFGIHANRDTHPIPIQPTHLQHHISAISISDGIFSAIFQGSKAMGKLNAKAKAGDEIIKVGITSSCKGDAVSQADVSGCFRKSNGDTDDNLKIEASDILGSEIII